MTATATDETDKPDPAQQAYADAIALRKWAVEQAAMEFDRNSSGDGVLALADRYVRFVLNVGQTS